MTLVLRSYQNAWKANTLAARSKGLSRLLLDAVGGSGKTTYAGSLALDAWRARQGRTLILENRQQLVEQTAKRLADETGLEVDIEMGGHRASPHAAVVVASVASLGRIPRLTGFPDTHFEYVFSDECHNSMADLFLRVMKYFHYGSESLVEGWQIPADGSYAPKSCVIGITATPDTNGKRNLGNFYQAFADRYSYLQAIEDGWLVGIQEHNIPVRIDTRSFRKKTTDHGTDFSEADETAAIIPVIEELAAQVVALAGNRKTMCYLPSKECVELMAAALNRRGLKALFVLGDCLDRDEKTEEFYHHGPGIVLVLCAMYVEGFDAPTVDTVAWFRPTLSPAFYKQGIYRCSRTLPGLVSDSMGAAGRRAAIASSYKPWSMVISPFFVSDKIDIMSVVDLFVDREINTRKTGPKDFTDAAKLRDYIAALEKAADKHANKQPRTINPISFALSVGDRALANYVPETSTELAKPTKEMMDFLLSQGIDTTAVKTAGEAAKLTDRLRERHRLGLATPIQFTQLRLQLDWPEDKINLMKSKQAGVLIWKRIRYKQVLKPSATAPQS